MVRSDNRGCNRRQLYGGCRICRTREPADSHLYSSTADAIQDWVVNWFAYILDWFLLSVGEDNARCFHTSRSIKVLVCCEDTNLSTSDFLLMNGDGLWKNKQSRSYIINILDDTAKGTTSKLALPAMVPRKKEHTEMWKAIVIKFTYPNQLSLMAKCWRRC